MTSGPSIARELRERFVEGVELDTGAQAARLRTIGAADAAAFAGHVAADEGHLGEHLPWPATTSTLEGARSWLQAYDEQRDGRVIVLGAFEQARMLGGALLFHHQPELATVEIGCWVVTAAEGRGVAAACCRALLPLARAGLQAERIEWHAASANVRSRRLAQRLGFTHEGTLRSSYVLREQRLDIDVLSLVGGEIDAAIDAQPVAR